MSRLTKNDRKYLGMYMSTYAFVGENQLEDVANEVLGLGWEAENDVHQIESILERLNPGKFVVEFIANCKFEDDIRVREIDNFSSSMVSEWFNNFTDYVENRDRNIYNEACKYADEREEGCI